MKLRRIVLATGAACIGVSLIALRRLPTIKIAFNSLDPERAIDDGSQFVDVRGLRVRTRVAGTGKPSIVLLHGFAASVFTWHNVFDELAKLGTVIAFDRPAYGFTSRPIDTDPARQDVYSMNAQVELTLAMLDHFGIDRAVLGGHSAGGTVAVATALVHPERVESLVLVAPAIYIDGAPPKWLHCVVGFSPMGRIGPRIARLIACFTLPIMRRIWHYPSLITPSIVEGYVKPFRVWNWDKAMWKAVRGIWPTHLPGKVGALRLPTLLVTGDDDRIVPVSQTQRAARDIPGAKLVIIPDCGHIPQEEQPEAFVEAVSEFVRSS